MTPTNNLTISLFDQASENKLTTLNQDDEDADIVAHEFVVYFVDCLICLFLIFSNSLLIYIIIANKKKPWARRTNHIFYLILCDLIVGVSLILTITGRLLRLSKKPYWLCASLSYNTLSTQVVSYYHMLAICIHRFRKLRKVDLPNAIDKYRYGVESFIIWIVVLLVLLPLYVFSTERGKYLNFCRLDFIFGLYYSSSIIYILTLFCLPCLLTNIIYITVICRMKNRSRHRLIAVRPVNQPVVHFINTQDPERQNTMDATGSVAIQQPSMTDSGKGQIQNRVIRIIGYLLVAINISILSPAIGFGMMLGGYQNIPVWIQALTYVNNIACPFIYSFSIAPLRDEMKAVLRALLSRLRSVIHFG